MTAPTHTPAEPWTDPARLLPCPFCGSAAAIHQDDDGRWTQVVCGGCGGKAPERMRSKEAAAEAWNRRASIPAATLAQLRAGTHVMVTREPTHALPILLKLKELLTDFYGVPPTDQMLISWWPTLITAAQEPN